MDKDSRIERMHYQANKFGASFVLLAIILNCIVMSLIYENLGIIPSLRIGIDILLNILFILVCFLSSEKVKVYSINWSIATIVLAGVTVLRIFFIPLWALDQNYIGKTSFIIYMLFYLIVAGLLVASGIISLIRSRKLRDFLKHREVKHG